MKIPIAKTPEGVDILLTIDHPACIQHMIPCLAVGDGPMAMVLGKEDRILTDKGLFDGARLVIEWLEAGPQRSQESRGLAMRFFKDCPEYL